MSNTDVADFAKYTIDNIKRATLANAYTITNRFGDGGYDFEEYVKSMINYLSEQLQGGLLSYETSYKLLSISYDALKYYTSDFKYSKKCIISNFIINLWMVFNGN